MTALALGSKDKLEAASKLASKSDAWSDLGLTLPIFLGYHLLVVFLPVRNAADFVTRELQALAAEDVLAYAGLTLAIGAVYVGLLLMLGRGQELRTQRFVWLAAEGIAYAVAMRLIAQWVIGELQLANGVAMDRLTGLTMALGAGFYEEIVFRVGLYGLGAKVISLLFFPKLVPAREVVLRVGWALVVAVIFSGWHHVGEYGDPFSLRVFVFRGVCGLVFTLIFALRGFAPAVWTHTLYDVWVLVL
jgi:hypothetical protein